MNSAQKNIKKTFTFNTIYLVVSFYLLERERERERERELPRAHYNKKTISYTNKSN